MLALLVTPDYHHAHKEVLVTIMKSLGQFPQFSGTKQRILEESARLFLSQGFNETSIRQIGAAAGVTSGALYKHFASKEEILEVLVNPVLEGFTQYCKASYQQLVASLEDPQKKPDVLASICTTKESSWMIAYFSQNIDLWRFVIFKSQGTKYSNFLERYIAWESDATTRCIEAANGCSLAELPISHDEIRAFVRGYVTIFLAALEEGFPAQYRDRHLTNLAEMYRPLWQKLFTLRARTGS